MCRFRTRNLPFRNLPLSLQCVFHSIRFKVNKGWSTAVLLFFAPYSNLCVIPAVARWRYLSLSLSLDEYILTFCQISYTILTHCFFCLLTIAFFVRVYLTNENMRPEIRNRLECSLISKYLQIK